MSRWFSNALACGFIGLLSMLAAAQDGPGQQHWVGTWAAAPQPPTPGHPQMFRNQTLRLIVHTSIGGTRVRIKISNTFGDHALVIGGAHIARRTDAAEIDPRSDRILKFHGQPSTTVAAGSSAVSDPAELEVPALSDLTISLFLPETTEVKTTHILAKQTSYVSGETGDTTSATKFVVANKITTWPFLAGVDVEVPLRAAAIVAFGSSLTDGDGTDRDSNGRWPDVLAQRLHANAGGGEWGVLNEGIIGNRLLQNSPPQAAGGRFGAALGEAGVTRFERDVLSQSGVKYVVLGLGINDIAFPGSLTPATEHIDAESIIAGYRRLIMLAHQKGIRIIGTTNPAFEDSFLDLGAAVPKITFYTREKEAVRQKVNAWILSSGEFDGVVDLDATLRDPNHPTRLLAKYDSGDHLHPNNAGCRAEGEAIPLSLFQN